MPINDYFIFDGKKSTDYGLYMASDPTAIHPARRGELFPIPGRNGSIVREDGSYDTYTLTYDVLLDSNAIASDVYDHARKVAAWLLGSRGFCRLEDSYEPEYFRLARCAAQMSVENRLARFGRAQIPFEVQPQRYLKSGETPIRFEQETSDPFVINNPTQFEARPLLKFVDTSEEPEPVEQSLEKRPFTRIDPASGSVIGTQLPVFYTSAPISTANFSYAIISGNGYTFVDNNGNSLSYDVKKDPFTDMTLIIPSGAVSIIVMGVGDDIPYSLKLKAARPNPGNSAATINGTTINLDFSVHDTIILDCDLHDAYYIDGSNANNAVSFSSNVDDYPTFPGLIPGENVVIPGDGTILDFELVPRWWTV